MVSSRPPTSKFPSPFNSPLVTVPNSPIMISIIVTFMFHIFFRFPSKIEILIVLFTFFQIYSVVSRDSKIYNFASCLFFFFLITMKSGLLAEIKWSVSMSKSHRICVLLLLSLLLLFLQRFSRQRSLMVFHRSLSDSKSPQVSRTLLSIFADLNDIVVCMLSTHPLISNSSSPFNNPLVTVTKAPITIGIIVIFMLHSFFNSLARSRYLSFFSLSFSFILWSAGTAKATDFHVLFSFFVFDH